MKRIIPTALLLLVLAPLSMTLAQTPREGEFRPLPVKTYLEKMEAGWLGQVVGVCYGGPTEFRWSDEIIPKEKLPVWTPELVNDGFYQDDLYVEMSFLRSLEEYGLDVSSHQAGIDFANTEFGLACANLEGRLNLRAGIPAPDSSHPIYNTRANDIDYQIESDYAGLISPGMPNSVIALGDKFGRLMNYGDGLYGGQFMGGMYAEAFFTDDIEQIVRAGLACIPSDSQYAEMVRDMLAWHKENPQSWEETWQKAYDKYRLDPNYQKDSNGGIDVKINGVAVLMGILYGDRDLDKTIEISTQCGWDSDCNPSSAGGVIFTACGMKNIPDRFWKKLNREQKFSYTHYNFDEVIAACEKLARQIVVQQGGYIENDAEGNETFYIPVQQAAPAPYLPTWAPGPLANEPYTAEEKAKIQFPMRKIKKSVFVDKMKGAWIGQIAGVSFGGPTEFRGKNRILPKEKIPTWKPEMINDAFEQDDIYVEMTFLRTLEEYGLDVSIRQAGIDFANSEYRLWAANHAGRNNLRTGIAPPDSSHPQFNPRSDAIDYQIEADYAGIISPGMPNSVIALGEKFGRIMNHGDGLYGGQFMGGMYAEAYFTDDIEQIVNAGLACIPHESQYAEMVRDMIIWHRVFPDSWETAWRLVCEKYRFYPEYQQGNCDVIDVKLNGACVLMGLLYGNRDLDLTIEISTRCGWDSDCNPSSAAGVLFTTYGFNQLPAKYTEKLDQETKFSYTQYNFPALVEVCEKLARQVVEQQGGYIKPDSNNDEEIYIPVRAPKPSALASIWAPGPIENSRFTDEEKEQIHLGPTPYGY